MTAQAITVVAQIKVKSEKLAEVKEELMRLQSATRKEAGCICYDLHQAIEDENSFLFYETWADKAALDGHFESTHFKAWTLKAEQLTSGPAQVILLRKLS